MFPSFDQSDIMKLNSDVHSSEIKSALFHIGGLKAPGFDGFPAQFYQKHWDLIGPNLIDIVTQAFRLGAVPAGLNHTLITLVPKCNSIG